MLEEIHGIKIDFSKLERDYRESPLKLDSAGKCREIIPKSDFQYLYNTLGLTYKELSKIFGIGLSYFDRMIKLYPDLKKSKSENAKACERIRRYENYYESNSYKDRIKRSEKSRRKTLLEKLGVDNINKTEYFHNIMSKKFSEIDKKRRVTNLEKFGRESYAQTDEYKQFYLENKNHMIENRRLTCEKRYGGEPLGNQLIKNKIQQTFLKKYGKRYNQTEEFLIRSYNTKKEHNSFGKSKEEDFIFEKLFSKFPDIIRQYKEKRYPFACDFYIPSLDLFIEYQGFVSHQPYKIGKPFNKEDKDCQIVVNKLIEKYRQTNKDYFIGILECYMEKDPIKRNLAKENNLNYLEFFNIKEFLNWFNKI